MNKKQNIAARLLIIAVAACSAFDQVAAQVILPTRPQTSFSSGEIQKFQRPKKSAPVKGIPPTDFKGVLISSTSWEASDPKVGLYNFSATSPKSTPIYINRDMGSANGTLIFDNKLYALTYFEIFGAQFSEAFVFDLTTGETIKDVAQVNFNLCATSLAYESSTGKIYGVFLNENHNAHEFGILDLQTMTRSTISRMPGYLYGLSFTPDGRLVGLNPTTGNLYSINKDTGAMSLIGQTGVKSKYATSGAVCPKTGNMYFAVCNDDESSLYRIDTNTAEAVKIYDFPDMAEIMGMNIPMPPFADNVPGPATSLEPKFVGLDLKGTIDFTAPATTFDGSSLEDKMAYILTADGNVVKQDSVDAGASISVPFEVTAPSYVTFTVSFSNTAGKGPDTTVSHFIGESTKPANIESVTLELKDGKPSLTWTPVNSLFYGGDFDASKLSYTVTRLSDNTVVASGLTGTSFTDEMEEPSNQILLSYEVKGVYNETQGDGTTSNEVVHGYLTPAFKETFASARSPYVKTWTIVDADGDGVLNWTHDSSGGRIRTKANSTSRDIYASPRIYLEPDRVYTVKYGVSSYSSTKTAHVSCYISDSLTPASFTRCLTQGEPISTSSKTTYTYFTADFSVDTPGFYYIGVKNEGGTGTYNYVDNFEVQAPALSKAPASPSEFKAVANLDGKKEVVLNFKAPEKTADGKTLTSLKGLEVKRGNKRIARIEEDVEPGKTFTINDTPEETGITEYTVAAFNEAGHGVAARASVFVGINVPGTVDKVTIKETKEGFATLNWKAPSIDKDGYPIKASNVRYNIIDANRDYIAENVTDTTYTVHAVSQGNRSFVYFYVQTCSDAGESSFIVSSQMLAVGTPYALPFNESFADGSVRTSWAIVNYNEQVPSTWSPVKEIPDFPSYDNDGGFVMSHSDDAGGKTALSSNKIKLDCEYPTFNFAYYAIPGSNNTIDVKIARQGEDFSILQSYTVSSTGKLGWERVMIPLDSFKGDTVRLELVANCVNNSQTHFDAIRVSNIPPVDMAILSVNTPEEMKTWRVNEFVATIGNNGREATSNTVISLVSGDDVLETKTLATIEPETMESVTLSYTPAVTDKDIRSYKVVISVEGDLDVSNNTSKEVTLNKVLPTFPKVKTISHDYCENGIKLNWVAPEAENEFEGQPLKLIGYRVYRNEEFLSETIAAEYLDRDCKPNDKLSYRISALYNQGESALSDEYSFTVSEVTDIWSSHITVTASNNIITIRNAAGKNIIMTTADGHAQRIVSDSDMLNITVDSGIYLIRIDSNTYKLIVR